MIIMQPTNQSDNLSWSPSFSTDYSSGGEYYQPISYTSSGTFSLSTSEESYNSIAWIGTTYNMSTPPKKIKYNFLY